MNWFDCRPDWMFWAIIAVVSVAAFVIGGMLA
jgi:hypothetical protein